MFIGVLYYQELILLLSCDNYCDCSGAVYRGGVFWEDRGGPETCERPSQGGGDSMRQSLLTEN